MAIASPYDILFEPIRIGPVTAPNRFYQVPHCSGMGYRYPNAEAAMRGVKAEGGWGVVCTQEVEIHPTSEISPYTEGRLWDERDVPALARVAEAVHAHGALAGIELVHQGYHAANRMTREPPIAPHHVPVGTYDPVQARAMSKRDIRELRAWHRAAALRAKRAGFDLVYVYAGHQLSIPMHFLSRRHNQRTDEYGGSLENRLRLLRELVVDTLEAVGDTCAVPIRLAVDELLGPDGITCDGEGREVVEMLAELPDLWDVNVSDWANDSLASRFGDEGFQEPYVAFVKQVTSKPVVGVGRFTSPDAMVSQIRRGVLDLIGAARPSIADPFLPRKIAEGRPEAIRECIGCNVCTSGDNTGVPMRCTQNATMGEEWRRGWHPERFERVSDPAPVLIVGAGPSGLECARVLGLRGHPVTVAEATEVLGGRVGAESALPGLGAWSRVRDYRVAALLELPGVDVYRASRLGASDVLELGFANVIVATGARWRTDGVGRAHHVPVPGSDAPSVVGPEAIMRGEAVAGPVLVYDDDHYYLGGVLAEKLRRDGHEVTLATPASLVSAWSVNTLEQAHVERRLVELGVALATRCTLCGIGDDSVNLELAPTGHQETRPVGTVVMVTARLPDDALYRALAAAPDALAEAGIESLVRIGDCLSPSTIAAAVYSGHRQAREHGGDATEVTTFGREHARLDAPR